MSEELLKSQNLQLLTLKNLYKYRCTYITEGIYLPFRPTLSKKNRSIWGCNWGISKENILRVNGFDEDWQLPCCGEDIDIDYRLSALGMQRISLKNKAILYHLHHEKWYGNLEHESLMIYERKLLEGRIFCENGIEK